MPQLMAPEEVADRGLTDDDMPLLEPMVDLPFYSQGLDDDEDDSAEPPPPKRSCRRTLDLDA